MWDVFTEREASRWVSACVKLWSMEHIRKQDIAKPKVPLIELFRINVHIGDQRSGPTHSPPPAVRRSGASLAFSVPSLSLRMYITWTTTVAWSADTDDRRQWSATRKKMMWPHRSCMRRGLLAYHLCLNLYTEPGWSWFVASCTATGAALWFFSQSTNPITALSLERLSRCLPKGSRTTSSGVTRVPGSRLLTSPAHSTHISTLGTIKGYRCARKSTGICTIEKLQKYSQCPDHYRRTWSFANDVDKVLFLALLLAFDCAFILNVVLNVLNVTFLDMQCGLIKARQQIIISMARVLRRQGRTQQAIDICSTIDPTACEQVRFEVSRVLSHVMSLLLMHKSFRAFCCEPSATLICTTSSGRRRMSVPRYSCDRTTTKLVISSTPLCCRVQTSRDCKLSKERFQKSIERSDVQYPRDLLSRRDHAGSHLYFHLSTYISVLCLVFCISSSLFFIILCIALLRVTTLRTNYLLLDYVKVYESSWSSCLWNSVQASSGLPLQLNALVYPQTSPV